MKYYVGMIFGVKDHPNRQRWRVVQIDGINITVQYMGDLGDISNRTNVGTIYVYPEPLLNAVCTEIGESLPADDSLVQSIIWGQEHEIS